MKHRCCVDNSVVFERGRVAMQNRIRGFSFETEGALEHVGRYSLTLRGFQYLEAQEALAKCSGNYRRTARALSIALTTLYRRLDRPDLLHRRR